MAIFLNVILSSFEDIVICRFTAADIGGILTVNLPLSDAIVDKVKLLNSILTKAFGEA